MKFGKVENVDQVNFTWPIDPEENAALLAKIPKSEDNPMLYVGCTGWGMKEWKGKVYPGKAKPGDFLKYYTEQFNTIELNTTHYRIPDFETIEKWVQASNSDFHFCPKVLQRISHSSDLAASSGLLEPFCNSIAGLHSNLGPCFIQLPPYFKEDRLGLLENFLQRWPSDLPLSVEVRHENWFASPKVLLDLMNLLQKYKVAAVITDVAGRRDVLHMRLTADFTVVRFVGNNLHPSDYNRIDRWVERMKTWFSLGLKKVYFFTHEPDNLLAPDLADYLVKKIKDSMEIQVRGPLFIDNQQDQQMSLF